MAIIIPKKGEKACWVRPFEVDGDTGKYLVSQTQTTPNPVQPSVSQPLAVKTNINREDYIQIPNTNILIAKQETLKGKNWNDTHYELMDNGLFMPTPALFMPYFVNMRDASIGKSTLYDGNNQPIARDEAEDLWKYLSTNHRNGCWTWLNALFNKNEIKTATGRDSKGNLTTSINLLEKYFKDEDCFVNLDFNGQGIPKAKSSSQSYEQGKNIYFYRPREGCVARFYADSDWAYLYCDWNPSDAYDGLGVFACAEGTARAKNGGKN